MKIKLPRFILIGFSQESDLVKFFDAESLSITTLCGLVFAADSFDSSGQSLRSNGTITYKIRLRAEGYKETYTVSSDSSSSEDSWKTAFMYELFPTPGPRGDIYGGDSPGRISPAS